MAATFPLPAAGCPMAPPSCRCAPCTKPDCTEADHPIRRAARPASHRYPHRGAQPAHRTVAEHDVAAMRARDVAGDGKPKHGAALILVAGVVEPQKRLEDFLAHVRRNARSVVVDGDREIAVIAVAGD